MAMNTAMVMASTKRLDPAPALVSGMTSRYSRKEWLVRIALTLAAFVLAYVTITFTFAQSLSRRDPATAHLLAPYSGRITALYASTLAGVEATPAERRRSDELAKRALMRDATAVAAVATLGINAEIRGDVDAARRAFRFAAPLSRRDLRTQLWLIEDAVRRGDVPGALKQYDVTLRANPKLSEMLYPILASASSDPTIRPELIRMLAGDTAWGESFISYMGRSIPDPASTATLFVALRKAGGMVPPQAWSGVINALIEIRRFDQAWAIYASVRPRVDRVHARDLRSTGTLDAPSLLDWVPVEEGAAAGTIQNGVFDFSAPASMGGTLLRQVQLLPPGEYRLTGHSIGIEQPDGTRPYWVLTCRKGAELGRVVLPNSVTSEGMFGGTIVVPSNCPAQELSLVVPPSDASSNVSGQIDRLELSPVR